MSKLVWDQTGEKLYETGVKNGVLYVMGASGYNKGVAWNGLTGVTESPSGAEATALYADDVKYLSLLSAEEFGATVEAYTYPDEFEECDGSASLATGVSIGQQARKKFCMCYQTTIGNDSEGEDYGYKLHFIYGAKASPSEKAYATINDNPEAITFSWELTTDPVSVTGKKPTASLVVDSTKADATKLKSLEGIIFGADTFSATSTYAVGDLVNYTGSGSGAVEKLYRCTTAVETAGAWSASNWTEVAAAGPRIPMPDEVATIMAVTNAD